jgi:poly-gamma-glutamate synthesis protein (capsule biosynthesis protein)
MYKKLITIVCFVAVGLLLGSAQITKLLSTKNRDLTNHQAPTTTLFFVGDIMLDRGVRSSVLKNFAGDYSKLFIHLSELKDADILFGNLEGDVSNVGNNVGSKFSFRMDPKVLPVLKDAGFDIVSFANNHVGDWNMNAFTDTLNRLNTVGIAKVGAGMTKSEAEAPTIIERNGVKFGFLGFSDVGPNWLKATKSTPGILLASDPRFTDIVNNAKKNCDVLIVSFHWGVEYQNIHTKRQQTLAFSAIDSGADMIIGHHPHVIGDIEVYNDRPIVYSLGNFIFDQYFSKDTMQGMLFEATFTGNILTETREHVIRLNTMYQPTGIYPFEAKSAPKKRGDAPPCPKPKKEYEDQTYLDVGQKVGLPDTSYMPSDLVKLDSSITKSTICLKQEAARALVNLITGAKKDGHTLIVSSGFRSYTDQKIIFTNNIKSNNANDSVSVAKPGHSEHQLGVAVDLTSPSVGNASAASAFGGTPESAWLQLHAHEYGFVQSYPKDKEDVTGYMYEPWHYRYVDIENAKEIFKSSQTVNEFLKEKGEVNNKKPVD